MNEYENLKTADIIAEALIDWNVDVIFGLPGDGINGFIEALRQRKNKIKFVPEHAEMTVDIVCRTALGRRGKSHLTNPIDVQERKLKGKYSRHKVEGHTSD